MAPEIFQPKTLYLTEAAEARLRAMGESEQAPPSMRVYISGGGCSGFRYCFVLDDQAEADDTLVRESDVQVLIDPMSLPYLSGATLDYREDLQGARFVVDNPQAVTTCGCGESFAV